MTKAHLPITIRPMRLEDAQAVARFHVGAWRESYQGIIDQAYLDALSLEKRLAARQEILKTANQRSLHLVACLNDEIIGFCDAGPMLALPEEGHGEVYALYVRKAYHRQGIGFALWARAKSHLRAQGLTPFIALAFQDNKIACAFYERQGGIILRTGEKEIGGRLYAEVCYGFEKYNH